MSGDRSILYAEQTLGVHDAYDAAKDGLTALRETQTAATEHAAQKRNLVEALEDQRFALVARERGIHPEMSATAFEQHMKEIVHTDVQAKHIRAEIAACQHQIDLAEAGTREHEFTIKVQAARLEELGGLLHFYAAVKAHNTNNS